MNEIIMIIGSPIRRQHNKKSKVSIGSVHMISDCLDTEVFAGLLRLILNEENV